MNYNKDSNDNHRHNLTTDIAYPLVNALVHGWLALVGPLHVEYLDQRLYCDALQEHSKVDHSYSCGHIHVLMLDHSLIDQEYQRKGHGTAQSAIGHYELIDAG